MRSRTLIHLFKSDRSKVILNEVGDGPDYWVEIINEYGHPALEILIHGAEKEAIKAIVDSFNAALGDRFDPK